MTTTASRSRIVPIAVLYVPLVALLAVVPLVAWATGVPVADLTRDVFSAARAPIYLGVVSNVGVLLWAATTAICLFAWAVARGLHERGAAARFLLAGGLFSALLLVDDFFMVHEWIVPRFLGIPEEVVLAGHATLAAAGLIVFRREIRDLGAVGLLVAALALFAAKLAMDVVEPIPAPGAYRLAEAGFKLLGIGTWLLYFVEASAAAVRGSR